MNRGNDDRPVSTDLNGNAYAVEGSTLLVSLLENTNELVAAFDRELRTVTLSVAFRREFELIYGAPPQLDTRVGECAAMAARDRDNVIALCRDA